MIKEERVKLLEAEIKIDDLLTSLFADNNFQRSEPLSEPSFDDLLELISVLTTCVKYERFDLESTRREKDFLYKQLQGIKNPDEPREA